MKIKKVDDKPITIHTKEKAKIHFHTGKKESDKKSHNENDKKKQSDKDMVKKKKATVKKKESGVSQKSKEKQSFKEKSDTGKKAVNKGKAEQNKSGDKSKSSIKMKNAGIYVAGAGGKAALNQLEGGDEIKEASYIAYEVSSPVTSAASKGAESYKNKVRARKRDVKKSNVEKRISKKDIKKGLKRIDKGLSKEKSGKISSKGSKNKESNMTGRKLSYFLDKLKSEDNQKDSLKSLIKDMVLGKLMSKVKMIVAAIAPLLLVLILLIMMIAIPVMLVIAILYNSPFALFLPPLEEGDTVQSVTSGYMAEFNREVNTLVNNHEGCEIGRLVYVDYEGVERAPSNYYDIMSVYMVKYGVEEIATVMNDEAKENLKTVFDDMCSYTTSTGTEDITITDAEGNQTVTQHSCYYVNVSLKDYRDMISEYNLDSNRTEMLEQMMSPEAMQAIGAPSAEGGCGGESSLSEAEINSIISGITQEQARGACSYALHRVGYPYSQAQRDSGSYYDCSSLCYYSWRDAGITLGSEGENTAAAIGKGLSDAGNTISYSEIEPGDLIFYSYTHNNRFMNISHVAIYVGDGKCVEALNENFGVVYRAVSGVGNIVLVGRPQN